MKPYHQIPILECCEPLVPLPLESFSVRHPHPYAVLGAPYGDKSPYFLRQGVAAALLQAQIALVTERPGWRIEIFDAYRPIAVQQFMVEHTLQFLAQQQGLQPAALTPVEHQALMDEVYQFWAPPSLDAHRPPPHSTGAAVDVTLVDASGQALDMGSPIDEVSPRSYPDYFATHDHPQAPLWHRRRTLLQATMAAAGFRRHPHEWWHFSLGDQLWAWLEGQAGREAVARYGRAELGEFAG